ncbi:MAG: DNA-binding protein [Segetibacter sp.]|nr:DNA-binding protein [Segetibacter sp.]
MGKSQETFNKKEKEKKRLQKRQEKQEKKEERQSNARDGNDLENMMAYLDENGNITSSPPDPNRKKRVINAEDIQIGVAKQEPMDEAELLRSGVVTMFNESKGYGFIKDSKSNESLFVHINSLSDRVREGDKVNFEVELTHKGKNAVGVKKIV